MMNADPSFRNTIMPIVKRGPKSQRLGFREKVRSSQLLKSFRLLLPTNIAVAVLFLLPSTLYIPEDIAFLRFVFSFWMACLHASPLVVAMVVGSVTCWLAHHLLPDHTCRKIQSRCKSPPSSCRSSVHPTFRMSIIFSLGIGLCVSCNGLLQVLYPSWAWFPFLWGRYRVYNTNELAPALQPLCIANYSVAMERAASGKDPLCLDKKSWEVLSAGYLSGRRPNDVENVLKGIEYAKSISGGLVVGILARDTLDAVKPLRRNMEALATFFPDKLSVVVFENDSVDGTREAFIEWAQEATGYRVDLMSCGENNPNCKLREPHRFEPRNITYHDFMTSPSAGKMPKFRQRLLEHVLEDPSLQDYSHMLIMDLDLAVSISPLGALHSLGVMPDQPIASSGKTPVAGGFGTIVLPYDTVATRYTPTLANQRVLDLHRKWCELAPAGDRWRFECPNTSPFSLMLTIDVTAASTEPYKMKSAFNGAVLYPLKLIRERKAFYHTGKDGQSCEHVGFHQSLQSPVYVNPKWSFHLDPRNPAGPTGFKGLCTTLRVMFLHSQSKYSAMLSFSVIFLFVWSVVTLVLSFIYPISCAAARRLDKASRQTLPLRQRKKDFRSFGLYARCDCCRVADSSSKSTSDKPLLQDDISEGKSPWSQRMYWYRCSRRNYRQ